MRPAAPAAPAAHHDRKKIMTVVTGRPNGVQRKAAKVEMFGLTLRAEQDYSDGTINDARLDHIVRGATAVLGQRFMDRAAEYMVTHHASPEDMARTALDGDALVALFDQIDA
jgi:hypothetical protein